MSHRWAEWPNLSADWSNTFSQRADELLDIRDALQDEEGLITAVLLPLQDIVLFPGMVTPLFIQDEDTAMAIEHATQDRETMIAVTQLDASVENPRPEDFYNVGTEVAVGRLLRIPDGTTTVLSQGRRRVEIVAYLPTGPYYRVRARPVEAQERHSKETLALMRAVLTLFEKCVHLNQSIPEEAFIYAMNLEEPGRLADLVVSALALDVQERQAILETFDPLTRLQHVSVLLGRELDVLELEDEIHTRVQSEVDRSQREMYLREQMKAIQHELGEVDVWTQEVSELRERVEHLELPPEVRERSLKELKRLNQMPSISPEVGVIRTYIDWLIELPWSNTTPDNLDIANVERVLDEQHHGLQKAKDRVLEYIAVKKLAPKVQRQPILCFVGPPGTGKTSLGQSIAKALGREFIRISLGGIRDEAEIRGHRRTYIGALPGRVLQAMRRAGTVNPLFMLDEIDKLGRDFRGDPASALLEVLDPEQNHAYSDHYLEIPYDLSKVLFITTANTVDTIPAALLDRLEVIEFPGYIEEEKLVIARDFLIPRQLEQNGLTSGELAFTNTALQEMIRLYTWEAGVRNLEREIGRVCRKVARRKAEGKKTPKRITPSMLTRYLGPPQITPHEAEHEDQIGTATGLAWTENGGESLTIEALLYEGKGNIQITGQIGDVMQESAQAALSYIKSRAEDLDIPVDSFENTDVHIHIPEGAIPKDGPSAGITIATALASSFTGRPVRRDVGMSGEITLRGRVLAIGGVREKILAAYRLKLRSVLIPAKNEKDLVELPRQAKSALEIHLVNHMDEVLEIALLPEKAVKSKSTTKHKPMHPRRHLPSHPSAG
jgi:ATP-dependent Lon protease